MAGSKGRVDEDLCRFLRREGVLSANGPDEEVETHAGHVFLADDLAFKLKKDVEFPFLNFGTVERRRAALAKELELNRPHAEDIYLGLSAITRGEGDDWELDGSGELVEPILRMRRFDQAQLLDRRAESGTLDDGLIASLARGVRSMHAQSRLAEDFDPVSAFEAVIDGNLEGLAQSPEIFSSSLRQTLETRTRSHQDRLRELLPARAARGAVRRCHGDLHLGNIVVWKGVPVPFDALEFDDELATSDVYYDLAFLLMDLLHRDLKAQANLLLSTYVAEADAEELRALEALPLYLSVRAAVRAKVEAARAASASEGGRKAAEESARSYAELAVELLEASPVRLFAVGGLSGTGKSTLARQVAPSLTEPLGALVLRSDLERRALSGVPIGERMDQRWYEASVTEEVYERLRAKAKVALASGLSVLLDAVHARPGEREGAERVAKELEVPFFGFWLEAPSRVLIDRVNERRSDASDANADVVRKQLERDTGPIRWQRLDTSEGAHQAAEGFHGKTASQPGEAVLPAPPKGPR